MSDSSATSSAWPLPQAAVKEWAKIHPDAPKVLVDEMRNDARHMRRYAWARLIASTLIFMSSTALSAYFVQKGMTAGGFASVGGGTVSVVSVMLTGKPLAIVRRR